MSIFLPIKRYGLPVMLGIILCTGTACGQTSTYEHVLQELRQNHHLPDSDTEFTWEDDLTISYATVDVNQDGIPELLVNLDYDSGPDGGILLYTNNGHSHASVHPVGSFSASCRFYDNGIVEDDLSHGSPYGGPYSDTDETDCTAFWPYQVWSYQAADASYTKIGTVTDWNKAEWSEAVSGYSAFPDEIDEDGDGIVYLLETPDGEKTAMDSAALKKWVQSYRDGAKEIPITYQPLR